MNYRERLARALARSELYARSTIGVDEMVDLFWSDWVHGADAVIDELNLDLDTTGWGAECAAQQAYCIASEREAGARRVAALKARMGESGSG